MDLPTALTIGPWDPGFQHAGPPAALLARAVERASGIEVGQRVRSAYDILGPVPVGPVRIRTSTVRPGRRIELLEAVPSGADDRPLMRLTAWRMPVREDAVPPSDASPVPVTTGPEDSRPETAEFFTTEVTYRTVHGGTGAAQAFGVLFDAHGEIGRSAQALFVEPR